MSKNQFKVGQAVVYKAPNGDIISAKITHVFDCCVYVAWYPSYAQQHTACVLKKDWAARVVPFSKSLFLAL